MNHTPSPSFTFFAFLALLLAPCAHAQVFNWGFSLGGQANSFGSQANQNALDIAVDDFGHLWFLGGTQDTMDVDPGPGISMVFEQTQVLARYGVDGTYQWSHAFGDHGAVDGHLCAAPNGDLLVYGRWEGGDADPDTTVAQLLAGRFCVIRYDPTGNYVWGISVGNYGNVGDVAVDGDGNVYISGTVYSGADMDPGTSAVIVSWPEGWERNFMAKYDADGHFLWVKTLRGQAAFRAPKVAVDPEGHVYLAGSVGDSLNMDPDGTNVVLNKVAPLEDVFIARYDTDGAFVWAHRIGGTMDGYAHGIAASDDGRVAFVGQFRGAYDFDPTIGVASYTASGVRDGFVASYDSTGAYQWTRLIGGSGLDWADDAHFGVGGDLTVGGKYEGTMLVNNVFVYGHGLYDCFLARLDPGGTIFWAFGIGGGDYDEPGGVAVGSDGSAFLAGNYALSMDLDPGTGNAAITSAGGYDMFVARYDGISTGVAFEASNSVGGLLAPNPVIGELNVLLPAGSAFDHARILDASGRVVQNQDISSAQGTVQVDVRRLQAGIYFLQLSGAGLLEHYRFLKALSDAP